MEAERFGSFVAQRRRERGMTQATLASELHVTDKAISRWERGVGFPDIGNIEPLADALGVSIVELMRAEKTEEQTMTTDEAEDACAKVLDITKSQQERETKDVVALIASLAVLTLLVEMIASLRWDGVKLSITMSIPATYPLIPVALIVYAIWRKVKGQTCELAASVGITLLVVPALILLGSFLLSAMTT